MRLSSLLTLASAGAALAALVHLYTTFSSGTRPEAEPATAPARMPAAGSTGGRVTFGTRRAPEAAPEGLAEGRYLYRWRDEAGRLHVASEPPSTPATGLERIPLEAAANGAHEAPEGAEPPPALLPQSSNDGLPELGREPMGVYTRDGFQALLRQTREVQGELDDRRRLLERLDEDL